MNWSFLWKKFKWWELSELLPKRGKKISSLINDFFWWWIFVILKKIMEKNYLNFFIKIWQNPPHNFLEYDRVLKISYFHVLNITNFGYIYLWMIATWATSQNWKKRKRKTIVPILSILFENLSNMFENFKNIHFYPHIPTW